MTEAQRARENERAVEETFKEGGEGEGEGAQGDGTLRECERRVQWRETFDVPV